MGQEEAKTRKHRKRVESLLFLTFSCHPIFPSFGRSIREGVIILKSRDFLSLSVVCVCFVSYTLISLFIFIKNIHEVKH